MSAQKKFTTGKQFAIMVDNMENHTDLITGCFSGVTSKASINGNWTDLERQLNGEGPTTRDADLWKKVWADYKNKIKKKMRKTITDINRTGGGTRTVFLSDLEERVVKLTGLTESVVGLSGFDAGHEPEMEMVLAVNISHEVPILDTVTTPSTQTIHRTQRRRMTATNRLFEELKAQGEKQEAQAKQQQEFNIEIINLVKEANVINNKRLMMEERRLKVAERKLYLEEGKNKLIKKI